MIFTLTDEQKQYCRTIGIPIPPDSIETDEDEYERNVSHWRTSLPDANDAAIHLKVVGRLAWKRHLAKRQTEKPESPSVQSSPQVHIHHADTWLLWAWRIAVLGLLCLIATHAHAQFSHVNSIQFDQGGSPITGGFYTYPFVFNCAGALTCTVSGNTVTATGGAGGSTSWDAITNPAGNLALSMAHYTTVLTYDATTGANAIMFRLTDTLNNTGTGALFQLDTASGSALFPLQVFARGTTNGWHVSVAGVITKDGSGGVDYGSLLNFPSACAANSFVGTVGLTLTCNAAITANAGATHNFLTSVTAGGVFSKAQPACADISDAGTACTAVAPANTTATTHQFFTAYTSATGAFTKAQPACADISDAAGGCSMSTTAGGDLAGTLPSPTVANLTTGVTVAGTMIHSNIAAPSSPASGKDTTYTDSTDLRFHDKNASGVIGTTVVADTGAANNYISAISAAGAISKSRPACATLSDSAASCSTDATNAGNIGSGTLADARLTLATIRRRGLSFTIGDPANSAALTTSSVTYLTVPFACTISGYNLLIDAGTITVKFWNITTGTALPTSANDAINSSGVSISSGTAIHSATVSDFSLHNGTTVAANSIMAMAVTAVATAKFINGVLQCDM